MGWDWGGWGVPGALWGWEKERRGQPADNSCRDADAGLPCTVSHARSPMRGLPCTVSHAPPSLANPLPHLYLQGHRCLCQTCARPFIRVLQGKALTVYCPHCRLKVDNIMMRILE